MTSAPAIGFEYRPSRRLPGLFIAVTGMALLAIFLAGVPWWLKLVLAAAVIVVCRHTLRRLHPPIYAVGWASQTGWTLRGLDGADDAATLLSFRIWRQVILLRLASKRYGKLTLWLMPDNSDADTRRRLRMRLAIRQDSSEEMRTP
jgi:toxin CptA